MWRIKQTNELNEDELDEFYCSSYFSIFGLQNSINTFFEEGIKFSKRWFWWIFVSLGPKEGCGTMAVNSQFKNLCPMSYVSTPSKDAC